MTANTPDAQRRLLPRWHTSAAAVHSGELRTDPSRRLVEVPPRIGAIFERLMAEWKNSPSIELAAELVATGSVLGRANEVEVAARYLTEDGADAAMPIREFCLSLLAGRLVPDELKSGAGFNANVAALHVATAMGKQRVRESPRNPLAWMDLAHSHSVLGQHEPAHREVRVALALAPENRFVLRSAARFFTHAGEIDHALSILRGSRALRLDPWVIAAEVALSTVAGQAPRSYRGARVILEADADSPWHTGELNGAFGTLALMDRSVGKARQFFRKSLRQPTENAIAQAQWAANSHGSLEVPEQLLQRGNAFEAAALKARNDRQWQKAVEACRHWSVMEPTSTRPLVLGGFMAEVALCDGATSLEFTRRLLVTAPTSAIALNNHIVALAYCGQLSEARTHFEYLSKRALSDGDNIVIRATEGLLAFRSQEAERGRELYVSSFEAATRLKNRELQAMVLWHLLREEARVGSDGLGPAADELWEKSKDLALPELQSMRDGIKAMDAANGIERSIVSAAAKKGLPQLPAGSFIRLIES